MGLRQWLTKALLPNPSEPSRETFIDATVTTSDNLSARWKNLNDSQKLAAYAHSLALDCAMFNAKNLASVPLRLYRGSAGAGTILSRGRGRAVTRGKMRHLTSPDAVGRKAAMRADAAGDVVEVTDSPALDLLRHPEYGETALAWDVCRFVDKQVFGEALILKDDSGPWLQLLMPQWARVQPDKERFISGWYYGRENHGLAEYDADDVFQMKWAKHPHKPYRGLGWVELALEEIGIDARMLEAESKRWQKGGYPKAHLALENTRTQQQIDEARNKLKQQMRDDVEVLVTSEGKLTPFALPKDMGFEADAEIIERRILNRAGIPITLYRMQDANRAAAASTDPIYARYTLAPSLAIDAEQWTELLLPWLGIDPNVYWFAYDEVSPQDREALRQDIATFVGRVWTPNEARAELGYEPTTGGDVMTAGGGSGITIDPSLSGASPTTTEGSSDAAAAAGDVAQTALNGAQVTALQGLAQSVALGQLPASVAWAIAEAAFPLIKPDTLERIFGKLDAFVPDPAPGSGPTEPEPDAEEPEAEERPAKSLTLVGKSWCDSDPYWGHIHTKDDRLESREIVRQIRQIVAAWLVTVGESITPDKVMYGFSLAQAQEQLERDLEPLVAALFRDGASQGFMAIGQEDDLFEVVPQAALDAVRRHNALIIEQIRGTTEDGIRAAIKEGLEQGLSADQTADLVSGAVADAAPWRSEAIARTETANAMISGKQAAWLQAGLTENRWLLATDACSICVAVASISPVVPIGKPFARRGVPIAGMDGRTYTPRLDVLGPPLHPNDRCDLLPVLGDE